MDYQIKIVELPRIVEHLEGKWTYYSPGRSELPYYFCGEIEYYRGGTIENLIVDNFHLYYEWNRQKDWNVLWRAKQNLLLYSSSFLVNFQEIEIDLFGLKGMVYNDGNFVVNRSIKFIELSYEKMWAKFLKERRKCLWLDDPQFYENFLSAERTFSQSARYEKGDLYEVVYYPKILRSPWIKFHLKAIAKQEVYCLGLSWWQKCLSMSRTYFMS